ncbi:MAG: hypothetical protein FWC73_11475 [Defluviitaleaceae bacterium]|nr:hypothetical protein [Defluviitaleaceae bacterium]
MNDKQNALEIIKFGKPDRVMTYAPCYGVSYYGADHQGYECTEHAYSHNRPVGGKWLDIWGTQWHKEYPDVMGFPKGTPLADISNLAKYTWPDPNDERLCSLIYEQAEKFCNPDEQMLSGSHRDTLWEKSYMLVGMENMMEYFYTEPEYAREILHNIMNFQLGIAMHYEKIGVEFVSLTDDMGTQSGLLLGKKIFDEFLYPEYKRIFDFYKSREILIMLHSCGHVEPLLESFIELGVNLLDPMQVTANNLENVISITQGRMAIGGGISTDLLMSGSPEEINLTVKNSINLLGSRGGYFCYPDQSMPFPMENVTIFNEAVIKYGKYPLNTTP